MVQFTVVVPTHDHADTLSISVASVLAQTRGDFELFIVGDGASARTREVAAELVASDRRVRYFDFPKGERHGERNRHLALQQAQSEMVAYHGDDDLWLPDHLETLANTLQGVDLAHTMQFEVWPDERVTWRLFNANYPDDRQRLMLGQGGFSLNVGGHTLAAYRRLPRGWWPAPKGIATDFHMWRQFVEQPWCRVAACHWPTAVHFSSASRDTASGAERGAEIRRWAERLADPLEQARLRRSVVASMAADLRAGLKRVEYRSALMAALFFPDNLDAETIARALPECPNLSENTPLRFARGEAALNGLLAGFSEPEEWGVWSLGESALLAMPVAQDYLPNYCLRLRLWVFLRPKRHAQCRFSVACEGAQARQFVAEQQELEVEVPLPTQRSPLLLVRFTIENPMAPAALGESIDNRRLGIGLREARIVPAPTGT